MMSSTPWIDIAARYLWLREIPGKETAPFIAKMLGALRLWWNDDETPWCGVFAGYCMKEAGFAPPKAAYRAKAWLNWGKQIDAPVYGCVVIFGRTGGGHVGFVIGKDERGRLIVRGGNQGNQVSDAPFDMKRVLGYRVPFDLGANYAKLPVLRATEPSSRNEA